MKDTYFLFYNVYFIIVHQLSIYLFNAFKTLHDLYFNYIIELDISRCEIHIRKEKSREPKEGNLARRKKPEILKQKTFREGLLSQ